MSQAASNSSPYLNSGLFSGYYLEDRIADLDEWECDEEAEAAFAELNDLWESEGDLLPSYKEDELLGSWIDEILAVLGYDSLQETTLPGGDGYNDRLLFESTETRREASRRKQEANVEAMYGLSSAILEAKQYDADFDRKFDEQRSYHDASHQIRYYLDRAGGQVEWGILTNGKEWRLYGTKDYATEIYYEVDLVDLLESGNVEEFKYFYAFFRPEAFREAAGTTFLDTVWNESETAAQELGEDLQDNVFTALRILGEGFVETNDFDIDPDDTEKLDELKEQSLVLLYRLMFVLYAESRGLMQPDDPEAEAEYDENFSLDQLRLEIDDRISSGDSYDDYSEYSKTIWSQLQDLFSLVDTGNDDLGVPPYNGGLFDAEEHEFLAENEVSDPYIAEVIHRLGTTENDDGEMVLADYADLDTRHLGTIYEGLLEHEFRIAPEQYAAVAEDGGQVWKPATEVSVADAVESVDEGGLYVVNDDGERKATGAYYTPDYVVSYIVEETIDPLLVEIKTELEADGLEPSDQAYFGRFYSQLLDLKILDPAMGSAHFLTNATGYLTEQVMEIVREQELQGRNEQELRRTIAKECIYGVDINGMAVELGKLSMWLETLAADKPLAFLDHHIKTGNSLIGSDITEVLSEDNGDNGGQLTLTQSFARARQQTLEHVMELMEDLLAIDNDRLSDIKSMEKLYDEIRDDPLYQRLFEIANVHTAEQFDLDVPEGVYEEMAGAIDDGEEWEEIRSQDWFASAQTTAEEQNFFHWELEYPEVFFGEDGEKLDNPGFDTIIGNPPYVESERMVEETPEQREYLAEAFTTTSGNWDLYVPFIELSTQFTRRTTSMIVPNKWLSIGYGESLRDRITQGLAKISDFSHANVFEDVGIFPIVYLYEQTGNTGSVEIESFEDDYTVKYQSEIDRQTVDELPHLGSLLSPHLGLTKKILLENLSLSDLADCEEPFTVSEAYDLKPYVKEMQDVSSESFKLVTTGAIDRYSVLWGDIPIRYLSDEYERPVVRKSIFEQEFPRRYKQNNQEKILISGIRNFEVAVDEECQFISSKSTVIIIKFGNTPVRTIAAILNSSLMWFYIKNVYSTLAMDEGINFTAPLIRELPCPKINITEDTKITRNDEIVNIGSEYTAKLEQKTKDIRDLKEKKRKLNLNLLDYFGNYSDGSTLVDIGLTQPPAGAADSMLQKTTETHPNLKIGDVSVERESLSTVEILLTARYKPDPEQKGKDAYTETEHETALRITDLKETEADLIEAFVPVAVDEGGGFAGFYENATKTNSLVDRLRDLTLPRVSDVESGLESYMQTKERAEELEAKIEQTDELIDEIVYELYGLTDEEIEIVEEAVST